MTRWIYSLLFFFILPAICLNLYFRGRQFPDFRRRWKEHFGLFKVKPSAQNGIWLHAVSVGEVFVAIPLIKKLKQAYPNHPITVTTTTLTGAKQVLNSLGDEVLHIFAPYDLPSIVKRFYQQISPKVLVILETELWPNLIYYGRHFNVPVFVVNARLSKRSASGYAHLPIPTKALLLDPVHHFACQYKSDAMRFKVLGASQEKVSVTGSIKFDLEISEKLSDLAEELFNPWIHNHFIWVAASTHEGEDEFVLQAHQYLLLKNPNAKLILVPRHPERFDSVAALIQSYNMSFVRRSENKAINEKNAVFLCDTMGELMTCYQAASIAFVGGSLVDVGGHNPLEPAALSVPVLTGQYTFNFSKVYSRMLKADAAVVVTKESLKNTLEKLMINTTLRKTMGASAANVVELNRGAINKTLDLITPHL